MNTLKKPYDWTKIIEASLLESDEIPMLGKAPSFPWEEFSLILAKLTERSDLKIKPSDLDWRNASELLFGVGENPKILNFSLSPLEGEIYWAISESDLVHLSSLILTDSQTAPLFQDPDFLDGFHFFLATETLFTIDNLRFLEELTPRFSETKAPPSTDCLCTDISITLKESSLSGRLLISKTFVQSWRQYFSSHKPKKLPRELLPKLYANVGAEVARTEISLEQWSKVNPGDFLVLDSCSLNPKTKQGYVTITINGSPTLQAKIQGEGLVLFDEGDTSSSEEADSISPPPSSSVEKPVDEKQDPSSAEEEETADEEQDSPSAEEESADKEKNVLDEFDDDDFEFDDDDDDDFDFDD